MKGAILREFNKIDVEELPIPKLENEEVLIKVEYAGICGSDIHVYSGNHPTAKLPVILGHELSGKIVDIKTKKITNLKIGDNVVAQPIVSCNTCDLCVQGRDNVCSDLKVYGVHIDGCFSEYVKFPIGKVYSISPDVDLRLASITEPLAVAVHDIRRSNLKVGQTVFIIGGGPIGILIAMVARLSGASKVVISEVNENRAKFIEDLGFTAVNPKKIDVKKEALEITKGEGFDVIFEVSGTNQGTELVTEVVKIGGTIIMVGFPRGNYSMNTGNIIMKELRVEGVRVHAQINFAAAIDILESRVLNEQLNKLITDEFKLSEIKDAIKFSIEDQKHFKVLLKI